MKKKHKPWVTPNEKSQRKNRYRGYWITAVASALFGLLALVMEPKKAPDDTARKAAPTRIQPTAARP